MATFRDKNTGVCISTDSELGGDLKSSKRNIF